MTESLRTAVQTKEARSSRHSVRKQDSKQKEAHWERGAGTANGKVNACWF